MQTTTAESVKRTRTLHWKRWLLVALAVSVLGVAAVLAYELNREHFPRLDMPPFDHSKAKTLTPAERAAYEQELFSELQQWNRGSRKYPTLEDIERREQRWQQMADDGFELAHITLSVLKPKGGLVYSLSGPMKRLEELAAQGDAGAMCLMVGLVGKATVELNTDSYASVYKYWLERGATIGHPECQKALGGRILRGVDGYVQDTKKGLELIFFARRAGYSHDVGALILHYESKGYADVMNVRRLYCWLQIESQSWLTRAPQLLLDRLQRDAAMRATFEDLKEKNFSLQNCIDLGTGE